MKHSKLAIILSLISLVGVIVIALLWVVGSLKLVVVSLDSFVGVVVALLGLLVTIILGWQIVNAIELREKMAELEHRQTSMLEIETQMAENGQNHTKLAFNLQAGLCDLNSSFYEQNGYYVNAFISSHSALAFAIKSGQDGTDKRIINMIRICNLILAPINIPQQMIQLILRQDNDIKESEVYRVGLSYSYEQMMALFRSKCSSETICGNHKVD